MKKLLLFVLAVMGFAACTQNEVEEQVAVRHDVPKTITVGFEGDDTRIQLNEAQKTVWTKGDKVSVFYFSDANQLWQYNGETGSRTANLKRVNAGEPTAQTTYNVVAYPFNEDYFLNTRTGALHATIPATQHYLKDSYGVGDNLMVAQSEFTQFSLKSVCGWLKLQLTGDGEVVKSITFKGKDGEQVAGLIHVDTATVEATLASEMGSADDNNAGGNLVFDDTILTEVTLDCGTGVTLGAEATAFYIALPPQTFEKGFKVEIVCADDTKMVKSSSNSLSIERNHIQPMAAFEFAATGTTDVPTEPENPINPNLPSNENNKIYYTTTDGKKMFPYESGGATFGAILISNIYKDGVGVMTFDDDVTMIGYEAFYSCTSLTSVTIPDSVTTIGDDAFYECSSLTSITIPDSVTTIGHYAFCSCSSLTSVTIPDSVTTIGDLAFAHCYSFTSVTIPDSVTTIGESAFYNCGSLTSVTIGDSVTTIGNGAFLDCDSLTEFKGKFAEDNGRILVVDGTLVAFALAGLTEYTIPDSVTTIGDFAFYSCDSLTSVTIPDSVTTIGESAFQYCSSLTSVTIGDSVTTIGDFAFEYCYSLTSVYCEATTPPELGYYVFDSNSSGRKIYVPAASVETYKSAKYWSQYDDAIVGYDFENGVVVE